MKVSQVGSENLLDEEKQFLWDDGGTGVKYTREVLIKVLMKYNLK
jgi:hypothetical protein